MLPMIVLFAELLVFLWFTLFLWLITSSYLSGKNYGVPKVDLSGLTFLRHVRIFVVLGIGSVVALSLFAMAGFSDLLLI